MWELTHLQWGMTAEELREALHKLFPRNATMWSQATSEVTEMCHKARVCLGLGPAYGLDFTNMRTPAEWNLKGINYIVQCYGYMNDEQRESFVSIADDLLDAPE